VLVGSSAGADEIHLKSGGRLSGIIVARNPTSVEIEVGAGRVTVPLTLVQRVETGDSPLSQYITRARSLAANDATGWLELAEWAHRAGLSSQAREAYQRVLRADPANADAHRALGHQLVGEQWLDREEAMQARGYVWFEGDWVAPAHRDTVLAEREAARRERADAERARLAMLEAEARAREAEARARTAELEAERAADERHGFVIGPGIIGPGIWGFPGQVSTFVVGTPTFGSPFGVQACCNRAHAPGRCPRTHGTSLRLSIGNRHSTPRRSERDPAPVPPRRERAVKRHGAPDNP